MFEVFGFYKFKKLTSLKKNKILLQDILTKKNIRGTIIVASEGENASSDISMSFPLFNYKNF